MVQDAKKEAIKKVQDLTKEYPIVGIVNMEGLASSQLQKMRAKLRDELVLFLTKKRLIKRAFESLEKDKKGIQQLEEYMRGIPALLFTKENPFKLFSFLQKNKTKAAAKAGQTCPSDITISKGPTQFPPGPIISELGAFGLKTGVEDGKVAILEDAVVLKEGEEVTQDMASLFQKMGIEPMEIGLDLVAVYEDGQIFDKSVLAIDEEEYFANFTTAHRWSFNLAMEAGVLTQETTELMLQKAFRDSKGLALEADILADAVVEEVLAKAENAAKAVDSQVDLPAEAPKEAEEKAEETKEAPQAEEKKEEPKEEAPEEKKEEAPKEAPSEEKKEEKPEPKEEKAEDKKDSKDEEKDKNVDDMVNAFKKQAEPKPSAEELVEESDTSPSGGK